MPGAETPIVKKVYELYRLLYSYRLDIPKSERYGLWLRGENSCLELLELILAAGQETKEAKLLPLRTASVKLNALRIFIRLAKDTRAIDLKKYVALQSLIDEIGRMLGGWLRSLRSDPPRLLATKRARLNSHLATG